MKNNKKNFDKYLKTITIMKIAGYLRTHFFYMYTIREAAQTQTATILY